MTRSPDLVRAPAAAAAGTVALPGSKSITNRTLLLAALATGRTTLDHVLEADDTARMLAALVALGVRVEHDAAVRRCVVDGVGGRWPIRAARLFLGNAGTAFRPLTAALAMTGGAYELSGVPRMHERPIGDLVDALRSSGATSATSARPGTRRSRSAATAAARARACASAATCRVSSSRRSSWHCPLRTAPTRMRRRWTS